MSSGGSVSSGMYSTATGFSTGPVPIEHASMVRGAHRVHPLCALQGTPTVCMGTPAVCITGYTRCVHGYTRCVHGYTRCVHEWNRVKQVGNAG